MALFASALVDEAQEDSGRSPLARRARDFAVALQGRSSDVLQFLTFEDRTDPRTIAEIREVMSRLGPDGETIVSEVTLEEGGAKGRSLIEVVRPTARGAVRIDDLPIVWVRTAEGEWKANWSSP